jgi:uncharacterized protein YfbU (UPF0304 family)
MPTISFRIDDELKERIDALVESQGLNVSALFRDALTDKVDELEAGDEKAQFRISLKERLGLVLQLKTLEKLATDEHDRADYARQIELLTSGYELHYRDLVEWFDVGFSARWCREVIDILSMFADLNWAFDGMPAEQQATVDRHAITFLGFDGNNETRQMAYARFFMFDMNRFQSLHKQGQETGLNSHCPMLLTYRRMLGAFRIIKVPGGNSLADHRLTVAQVNAVVAARHI